MMGWMIAYTVILSEQTTDQVISVDLHTIHHCLHQSCSLRVIKGNIKRKNQHL